MYALYNNFNGENIFEQINERKQFRILQDERILYLYIDTNIFCFDAVLDFAGDLFMLRVEGDSLTKITNAVKSTNNF